MMEIALASLVFGSVYATAGGFTASYLTQSLLAEKRMHLDSTGKDFRVLAGPRQEPLSLEEVDRVAAAASRIGKRAFWSWPLVLVRLRNREASLSGKALAVEQLRSVALEQNRKQLLSSAIARGYTNDPIMIAITYASTAQEFAALRHRIETGNELAPAEQIQVFEVAPVSQAKPPVTLMKMKSKRAGVEAPKSLAEELPAGYSWDISVLFMGRFYEFMSVTLLKGNEPVLRKFFRSRGLSPRAQQKKIAYLQRIIVKDAQHVFDGGLREDLQKYRS